MKKLLLVFVVLVFGLVMQLLADDARPYNLSVSQVRDAKELCPTATTYVLSITSSTNSTIAARTYREKITILNTGVVNVGMKLYYPDGVLADGYTIYSSTAVSSLTGGTYVQKWESTSYTGAIYLRQNGHLGPDTPAISATVSVIEEFR